MQDRNKKYTDEINSELTPEQQKIYKEHIAEMKAKRFFHSPRPRD